MIPDFSETELDTGHTHYTDLTECVSALLQTQSDHERERRGSPQAPPTRI